MRFAIFIAYLFALYVLNFYVDIVKPMASAGIVFSGWMIAIFVSAAIKGHRGKIK